MARRGGEGQPDRVGGGGSGTRLSPGKKILFALITLLVALSLLELSARLLVTALPNIAWDVHRRQLEAKGFPDLSKVLAPDPIRFWKLKPGLDRMLQTGRMGDFPPMRYSVSTDERGFRRGKKGASGEASRQILFLGDSSTFGMGVEDDETIPARVEAALDGVRCINAAVPGYTSYQGRVLLERVEFDPIPDVVVINFGFNEALNWADRGDLEQAARISAERSGLLHRSRFVGVLRALLPAARPSVPGGTRPRLTETEFETELHRIIDWCRSHGARPVLVRWPLASQMTRRAPTPYQAVVGSVARSERIPLIDLLPVFRAHGGTTLYLDVVHANASGCEQAARAMLPMLRRVLREAERDAGRGATPGS